MGERLETWRNETKENFRSAAWFVFFASVLAGPGLIAYQCYHWLRWGIWDSITLGDWLAWQEFPTSKSGWVGVQRIVDVLLSLPMWLVAPTFGLFMLWIFFWGPENQRRENPPAKISD